LQKYGRSYKRGELYYADLDPHLGSEQGGFRPVLVLQNNTGNFYCPTLIVAPLTSRVAEKHPLPTHVLINQVPQLEETSLAMLEQIRTIDKKRITAYIGKTTPEQMKMVNEAIEVSMGIKIPEEIEAP